MQICDNNHDEIVFTGYICPSGYICPLCEAFKEIESLENTIKDLKNKIADLENEYL